MFSCDFCGEMCFDYQMRQHFLIPCWTLSDSVIQSQVFVCYYFRLPQQCHKHKDKDKECTPSASIRANFGFVLNIDIPLKVKKITFEKFGTVYMTPLHPQKGSMPTQTARFLKWGFPYVWDSLYFDLVHHDLLTQTKQLENVKYEELA